MSNDQHLPGVDIAPGMNGAALASRFRSTVSRVRPIGGLADRYSIAYFVNPDTWSVRELQNRHRWQAH